jgi:hypothetical protein
MAHIDFDGSDKVTYKNHGLSIGSIAAISLAVAIIVGVGSALATYYLAESDILWTAVAGGGGAFVSSLITGVALSICNPKEKIPNLPTPPPGPNMRAWIEENYPSTTGDFPKNVSIKVLAFRLSEPPSEECTDEEIDLWLKSENKPIEFFHSFTFEQPNEKYPYAHTNMSFFAYIEGKKPFLFQDIKVRIGKKEGTYSITFEYNGKTYIKTPIDIKSYSWHEETHFLEDMLTKSIAFQITNDLFSERQINLLKKEGHNATIYEVFDLEPNVKTFKIPDYLRYEQNGQTIIFIRDSKKPDIANQLWGFPELQDKLSHTEWTWKLPPNAIFKEVYKSDDLVHVEYTYE